MSGDGVKLPLYGDLNGKRGSIVGYTLVDKADLPRLEGLRLGRQKNHNGHRACIRSRKDGAQVITLLHTFLMQPGPGFEVDHINHDQLDNRRSNLRLVTHQQNIANRRVFTNNKLGFKGVVESKTAGKYLAQIGQQHLGTFASLEEAARAYDRAALALHGEFAYLNFPQAQSIPQAAD